MREISFNLFDFIVPLWLFSIFITYTHTDNVRYIIAKIKSVWNKVKTCCYVTAFQSEHDSLANGPESRVWPVP